MLTLEVPASELQPGDVIDYDGLPHVVLEVVDLADSSILVQREGLANQPDPDVPPVKIYFVNADTIKFRARFMTATHVATRLVTELGRYPESVQREVIRQLGELLVA